MKFSLILSTKGRVAELDRFLESLSAQTLQDFEIIVSDQNEDDRLSEVVKRWPLDGKLIHLKTSSGLSRGRNAGLDLAKGEIIGFPDDDCRYFPNFLERVADFFETHPEFGFLSGRSVADDGSDAASRHSKRAASIERLTIFSQCIEFAFFIRRDSLGELRFDQNLGVGSPSPWQADEGPDLMLCLKEHGVAGYYDPQYAVWHPKHIAKYDDETLYRGYKYACGTGYFLRKHEYPLWFFAYRILKMSCGVVLFFLLLNPRKGRHYLARIRGQLRGWRSWENWPGNSPAKTTG